MARRKKPKQVEAQTLPRVSDMGTEELSRQFGGYFEIVLTQDNHRQKKLLMQIPLDYYRELNVKRPNAGITPRQWEAGNKLYEEFCEAGMHSPSVDLWNQTPVDGGMRGGGGKLPKMMLFWENTLDAMKHDKSGAGLLVAVCCYGYLLKDIRNPWYGTSQLLMCRFREALDHLADHYGLPRPAR